MLPQRTRYNGMNAPKARSNRSAAKKLAGTGASDVATPEPLKLAPKGPPEVSQGEGLGALISAEEGRERLAAYATPP